MKQKSFSVWCITTTNESFDKFPSQYDHWSENTEMIIQKNGISITLDSDELKKLINSLPRTVSGKYK